MFSVESSKKITYEIKNYTILFNLLKPTGYVMHQQV